MTASIHMIISGLAGCLLQIAGIIAPMILPCNEITLLLGLLVYCFGSLLLLMQAESYLMDHALPPLMGFWVILSIPGCILLYLSIKNRGSKEKISVENRPFFAPFSNPSRGKLFIIIISIMFFGGMGVIVGDGVLRSEYFEKEHILRNELKTYGNIKEIIAAQAKYIQTDWDQDSKKSYARFIPHLYQSVDLNANPVPVKLLRKNLAFADTLIRNIDGYYYVTLYQHNLAPINFEKRWASIAVPLHYDRTGRYVFLFNHTEKIYIKDFSYDNMTKIYRPFSPETKGWQEVTTQEALKKYQQERKSTSETPQP